MLGVWGAHGLIFKQARRVNGFRKSGLIKRCLLLHFHETKKSKTFKKRWLYKGALLRSFLWKQELEEERKVSEKVVL